MQEKLNKLLQALQGYHSQRIILFGSVARGDADAESDLVDRLTSIDRCLDRAGMR